MTLLAEKKLMLSLALTILSGHECIKPKILKGPDWAGSSRAEASTLENNPLDSSQLKS